MKLKAAGVITKMEKLNFSTDDVEVTLSALKGRVEDADVASTIVGAAREVHVDELTVRVRAVIGNSLKFGQRMYVTIATDET